MSDRVGVEIAGARLRAVCLGAWSDTPRTTVEVDVDPAHPDDAVATLTGRLGRVGRVALAVGLEHLHVKHVELPPAPLSVRRRMVAIEPDRFFPVQEERVVVGLEGNVAFAAEQGMLGRWVEALEAWAPVESIEPAPVALARVLAGLGDAAYDFTIGERGVGLVELRSGRLAGVRRLAGAAGGVTRSLPDVRGVRREWLAAWGAARGLDGSLDGMMLTDDQRQVVERRRTRRVAGAAAACAIAVGFALWALDRSRDDVLARLTAEQVALESRAAPAARVQAELAALQREALLAREVAVTRADPLGVLAALGERLPRDVTVLNARAVGNEWRIDGTAQNAAAILPALDGDARFVDARFLGASARFREGGRTYESFSLAFRAKPGA